MGLVLSRVFSFTDLPERKGNNLPIRFNTPPAMDEEKAEVVVVVVAVEVVTMLVEMLGEGVMESEEVTGALEVMEVRSKDEQVTDMSSMVESGNSFPANPPRFVFDDAFIFSFSSSSSVATS